MNIIPEVCCYLTVFDKAIRTLSLFLPLSAVDVALLYTTLLRCEVCEVGTNDRYLCARKRYLLREKMASTYVLVQKVFYIRSTGF